MKAENVTLWLQIFTLKRGNSLSLHYKWQKNLFNYINTSSFERIQWHHCPQDGINKQTAVDYWESETDDGVYRCFWRKHLKVSQWTARPTFLETPLCDRSHVHYKQGLQVNFSPCQRRCRHKNLPFSADLKPRNHCLVWRTRLIAPTAGPGPLRLRCSRGRRPQSTRPHI